VLTRCAPCAKKRCACGWRGRACSGYTSSAPFARSVAGWLVLCTWVVVCSQRKDLFVVVDLGGACGRIRVYFFNVVCTAGMLC
jgi:hypothetical protein